MQSIDISVFDDSAILYMHGLCKASDKHDESQKLSTQKPRGTREQESAHRNVRVLISMSSYILFCYGQILNSVYEWLRQILYSATRNLINHIDCNMFS